MSVSEKIAYLRGLVEGLKIDDDSDEGKIVLAVIDVLDEIATELSDTVELIDDLGEYVEEVDESLCELEDDFYGDDCDDCDCDDCDCDDCGCVEFHCPGCDEDVCVDFDCIDEDNVCECPNCGAKIECDFDDDDDDDDEDENDD